MMMVVMIVLGTGEAAYLRVGILHPENLETGGGGCRRKACAAFGRAPEPEPAAATAHSKDANSRERCRRALHAGRSRPPAGVKGIQKERQRADAYVLNQI